jgi:hypothetical protein
MEDFMDSFAGSLLKGDRKKTYGIWYTVLHEITHPPLKIDEFAKTSLTVWDRDLSWPVSQHREDFKACEWYGIPVLFEPNVMNSALRQI